MLTVKSVTFGTDARGNASGVLGYTINFDKIKEDTDILTEIANVINTIEKHRMSKKYKSVFITGDFEDVSYEYAIMTMLKALKDRGFIIYLTTLSTIYHSYYILVDYLRIHLYPKTTWAGFQCNEIVYHPDNTNFIDPDLPSFNILCSLAVAKDQMGLVPKFLDSSKYTWNIVSIPETSIKEVLFTK